MEPVTVAIPFYQGIDFLRGAIDSVLAQSSADWRLLVVDDSAGIEHTDAVRTLVDSFADDRIRSVRNASNLGMVGTWNRCIDEAATDLVTLLHGDDRLLPGYVALMQGLATRHPGAAALYCGARIIDDAGRETFSFPDAVKGFFAPKTSGETVLAGEPSATALMSGNFIMCPTLCFRRSVLRERRFEPGWAQVQDLELTVRLLMDGDQLVGAREEAYAYRRHPESATSRQSESRVRFEEEFQLFDRVAARAGELGWKTTARVARGKRIVKLHLLYRGARDLLALRPRRALATLRYLASRW